VDVLEITIVALVCFVPPIIGSIYQVKSPDAGKPLENCSQIFIKFSYDLAKIFLLIYIALNQYGSLSAVGIGYTGPGGGECGVVDIALILILIYGYLLKRLKKIEVVNLKVRTSFEYRTFSQRFYYYISLVVSVIAEEMLYRGYLVLLLGNLTGQVFLFAVISIVLSVIVHLYQGLWAIPFHIIMASSLVAISIIGGSIYFSFAFHMFWNTISIIKIWIAQDRKSKAATESNQE
jgi:membrane protease YdiL (CAAX protease family)